MKKQTSNTFTKGLLKDFHPLTVPNDVMTDALNATLITMNGNEGILQNDMGNGRVESAFLPPGYVPIGMKEYGGIIYIASYNPITNKSLIGSFPSPERNIDLTEVGTRQNPLNLGEDNGYTRNYKYPEFNKDTYMKGLGLLTQKIDIFGEDTYIRAGDKFGFYFKKEHFNNQVPKTEINFLSNYNNNRIINDNTTTWDDNNKVYRNKEVTLSVQVLDASNNLRDITDQLKRYGCDSVDYNKEDLFNSGYFIGDPLGNGEDPVNVERDKSALNTYNNKIYGKLFLVGKLNVIDHIDVSYTIIPISSETESESESNVALFSPEDGPLTPNQGRGEIDKSIHDELVVDDEDITINQDDFEDGDGLLDDLERPNDDAIIIERNDLPEPDSCIIFYILSDHIPLTEYTTYKDSITYDGNDWSYDTLPSTWFTTITNDNLILDGYRQAVSYLKEENNHKYKYILLYQKCAFAGENSYTYYDNYDNLEIIFKRNNISDMITKLYAFLINTYYYYNCNVSNLVDPQVVLKSENNSIDISYPTTKQITNSENFPIENYDPITNLYRVGYKSNFTASFENQEDLNGILHYLVIPKFKLNSKDYKLTHIAYEGAIDLLKIGQNATINTWRYRYMGDKMHLIWGLEDYIYDTDEITDMYMEFYDLNTPKLEGGSTVKNFEYRPYVRTSYSGGIHEYIDFSDELLTRRHIYKVKLYRTKNGETENLGTRIMITTPIYNSLFNEIEDYGSNDGSVTGKIKECNKIKLNLDISNSKFSSSGLLEGVSNDPIESIIVDDTSYQDNIRQSDLTDFNMEYSIATTDDVKLNLSISDVFPFEIKTPEKITYTLNINPVETNDRLSKINGNESNWTDDDACVINNVNINGTNTYSKSGLIGNQNISIKTNRTFKSKMYYKYKSSSETLPFIKYKKVLDYVSELVGTKIYFLINGVDREGDNEQYIFLFGFDTTGSFSVGSDTGLSSVILDYNPSNGDAIYYKEHGGSNATFDMYNGDLEERIIDLLDLLSSIETHVFLFASPATFKAISTSTYLKPVILNFINWHNGGTEDELGVDLKLKNINNDFQYKHAYLVWRSVTGNLIYLNSMFRKQNDPSGLAENRNDIISGLLGKFMNVYFKTNTTEQVEYCYTVDPDQIVYNSDYNTEFYNDLSLSNITLANGFKLNYFDNTSKVLDITTIDNVNTITVSDGEISIKFEISTNDSDISKTKSQSLTIPGILDIANYITNIDNKGFILDSSDYYFNVSEGKLLEDDFYILTSGLDLKHVYGKDSNKYYTEFFSEVNTKFTILNGKLLTNNYDKQKGNSPYYSYASNDIKQKIHLSRVRYINIPGFSTSSYINTYLS